jgi:CRISPR-associated endonuclease/helicase Cas3
MTDALTEASFAEFFRALWGHEPFPWQTNLAEEVDRDGTWPATLPLPTGAGKTAALDVALFHLARQAGDPASRTAPCRIVLVVDRRIVVDGAYRRAGAIRDRLLARHDPILHAAADRLAGLAGDGADPLRVARLRGGLPFEPDWVRTPSQPAMVISTVDQVGSRLLFRGYGVSPRMWPVHAGLLGRDSLLLVDEAHLSQPFWDTLEMLDRQMRARNAPPPARVFMSATPVTGGGDRLTDDDRADERLAPRLRASKPAKLLDGPALHDANGAPNPEFVDRVAEAAWTLSPLGDATARRKLSPCPDAPEARIIGVVVNRVGVARALAEQLRAWLPADRREHVLLRIGRTRPLDREAQTKANDRLMSGRTRTGDEPITFVVATQSIEVGADLDLDALVTQCAPLDSLRQRFGRLDRLGERTVSPAIIVTPKDDRNKSTRTDPVYGQTTGATHDWLRERATNQIIDFGIDHLSLPDPETLGGLIAPRNQAPLLFPAYVDKWRKTAPAPAADPDLGPFLHGPERGPADVSLVWRDDLDSRSDRDEIEAILGALPPTAPEALAVPLGTARAWLRQQAASLADVEGADAALTGDGQTRDEHRPIRWHADGSAERIWARQIRPGDTLVVPAGMGGCTADGWAPASATPVRDLGEDAILRQRRRLVLRVTRERLDAVGTDLTTDERETAWRRIAAVLADPPTARADLVDTLRAVTPLPVIWQARLEMLAHVGIATPMFPQNGSALVLSARRRLTMGQLRQLEVIAEDDADAPATESDRGSFTAPVPLAEHSRHVAEMADRLARHAGYPEAIAADVRLAARLHDLGKAEPRFQILLRGGDELAATGEPLAKGTSLPPRFQRWARDVAGLPDGARHEAWSVALAEHHPDLARANDRDLVLWLIGTHHGHGRPCFPVTGDTDDGTVETADPETGARVTAPVAHGLERLDGGWSARWRRLENRYGVWGLAHLEAVLRLADHRASEREGERP